MERSASLLFTIFIFYSHLTAQTLYVDAAKGSDENHGLLNEPLASLQKAVSLADQYPKTNPVTIKIAPGLYVLHSILRIESLQGDTAKYILEAMVMPDDSNWTPASMPVIESISVNNDRNFFDHCAGIDVERANTTIRGLKFVGNTNPAVDYYYPIVRDSLILNNLDISQCYFIGDRYGSVVQGAIYAEGPGIYVDHCIFYGCKNAVLVFEKVSDFSLTHSIVYGAYEAAVWYGYQEPDEPFIFSDNIISHCNYFWASSKDLNHSSYRFNHSLICENDHYVGMQNGQGGVGSPANQENYKETNIRKSGSVKLVEVKTEGLPHDYLNLAPDSDGKDIEAGIFKTIKK
jgi:hypothetical protein